MKQFYTLRLLILFLVLLFTITSCSTSKQARSLNNEGVGFLSNYSQLQEGKDNRALRNYRNPNVDWSRYNRVMIDPVKIYIPEDSEIADISKKNRLTLANYFHAVLTKELGQTLQITTTPDHRTLRVRVAITDASASNVFSDTMSTIVPFTLVASEIKDLAVGRPIGVGDIQIEAEFQDAYTSRVLAAGIDRRVGGKSLDGGKFDEWSDVTISLDHWATTWHKKLIELRK